MEPRSLTSREGFVETKIIPELLIFAPDNAFATIQTMRVRKSLGN